MESARGPPKVKNKAAAPIQISAEQLLREAVDRQEVALQAPTQRFSDLEELHEHQGRKRREFEDYSKAKAQAQMQSDADALNQQLNPNAPTFMAGLFRPKDKDTDGAKDKTKGKAKDKSKATTPSLVAPPMFDESPTDSRKSRDAFSVHTQTSVSVTESRESLSLERTFSNTLSDNHSSGAPSSFKDQESAMRKLFRKGSSSKFSLSSRLGKESGLFKKGPGSTTNSDKNYSMERSSIGDIDDLGEDLGHLGRSYDSVGSSPSLGPSKSKESKEGRIAGWSSRFSMNSIKKKGKEAKDSLDIERSGTETEADEKKEV
ncbi:Pre-mRNA-splicing factor clf1 like protein [Verticillium longisporum]|nr:Pre-mRNA-splicing factor clf1 like protein [Verticillium longisporum]